MKRTLFLACLMLSTMHPSTALSQAPSTLTGRDAADRFIGNSMVIRERESDAYLADFVFVIYFEPGGRAAVRVTLIGHTGELDPDEAGWDDEASWLIDDQRQICVIYDGAEPSYGDCLAVTVTGNEVHSVQEDIFHDMRVTLVEDNPYQL